MTQDSDSHRSQGIYTSQVAVRLTGIDASRIRRYEEADLIKPSRTEGRQRLYTDAEIELIKEISRLEDEGINIAGIKAILAMRKGQRS